MFGFYDPQSLTIEEDKASILFINARDINDIHVVEITTPEEARRIEASLETQKVMKITALDGEIVQKYGLIVMSVSSPGEGVIQVPGERNVPFVLDFEPPESGLPPKTRGLVFGYQKDGALVVDRIAVSTGDPVMAKVPADPQMEQREG